MNNRSPDTAAPRRGYAILLMVISSVTISFGGLIMRSLETTDTWQINFYRSIGLLLAVTIILQLRFRHEVVATIRGIGSLGVIGGILLSFAGIAHVQAMADTTIANVMFALGAIPFFTALFARIFLGERLKQVTLYTMIVAGAGLGVMFFEGLRMGAAYGNMLAIFTAITFSFYAIIVRKKRQQEMLPTLLVSSLVIITVAFLMQDVQSGMSRRDIVLCLVWGALLTGVANALFIYAARHLAAAEVTLYMMLEFALAPLWVALFVNEIPDEWTILGGVLILSAVVFRAIFELSRQRASRITQ